MAKLGDYEVLRALKTGGMGEVLLARRHGPEGFERLVAIKTIRAELAGAAAVRAMFLDEAKLLARLVHPAIAQVTDFGEEAGGLYLVMEYVPGVRFRELAERRVPPAIAARAIAEAARGVHAAHELRDVDGHWMGVVHRDLSPENLMLGWDGQVKVLDFGIALVKGRQAPVTEVGTVKGKPPYMSPEQVKNETVDRRSDVWSLGCVLHEVLTGQPVFDGESIYQVARNVVVQEIVPPSRSHPMPAGLDAAVMRALDRELATRTPTAAELAEELERIATAEGAETVAAWTTRELASEREAHRVWLRGVVARATGMRAAIGRPSGVVTAIAETLPAVQAEPEPEPDREPERARRSWWWLFLLLPIAAAIGVYFATRGSTKPVAVVSIDAAPAPIVIDAPVPIVIDAPVPIDASIKLDARATVVVHHVDAAIAIPITHPDAQPAAVPPPPTGAGKVTFTADPYALIRVDGNDWGSTPKFGAPIPAGRHRIQLVSPDDGSIRYDHTLDVKDGERLDVHP
ncbi:MAG TPA: serine/threonine-protein kinase [Kofleriaceae bacterium]|nr:serine/threonine-protein kinase [Kofleriaceae bacterium]